MDSMIKGILDSYVGFFATYSIKDEELSKRIEAWKKEVTELAEKSKDMMDFNNAFMANYQEEYLALVTAAATSSSNTSSNSGSETTVVKVPTVSEFVEQYREPYQEIQKYPYRKRGLKAYENIFNLANTCEDILDAQIVIEKERLLWKIVSEDSLDIFETIYEAMDPLAKHVNYPMFLRVKAYKEANSDEELAYLLDRVDIQKDVNSFKYVSQITYLATIAAYILGYWKARISIWEYRNESVVQGAIMSLINIKATIKRTLGFLKEYHDLTFDDLISQEETKIWLLSPYNLDELGRIKKVLHPINLQAYKEIIDEEIFKDLSIEELTLRKPKQLINLALMKTEKEFDKKAESVANELNKDLTYFKNADQLRASAGKAVEKKA